MDRFSRSVTSALLEQPQQTVDSGRVRAGSIRKVRQPKVQVRPREVFYHLKRTGILNGLNEDSIEEVLLEANLASLIEPVCFYENCKAIDLGERPSWMPKSVSSVTVALAGLGDAGLVQLITQDDLGRSRVFRAWAEICLQKYFDLTNNLIAKEAAVELLEIGFTKNVDPVLDQHLWALLWEKFSKPMASGQFSETGFGSGIFKESAALRRCWIVPWLTKKEKKLLASTPAI